MNYYLDALLLFTCFISSAISHLRVSENLNRKLDRELQQMRCCTNNLECCKEKEKDRTTFEFKAILTNCPNIKCKNISSTQEVVVHHDKNVTDKLSNCNQKLLLTVKVTNQGVLTDNSQYVIIDHVTDATNMKKVRILNPYAVRIRQGPLLQTYELKFEKAVNSEAREVVFNQKNTREYRGCNTGLENPTCGIVQHDGKIVPYSTGFCCSCDKNKNRMMEEQDGEVQWPGDEVPEYHKTEHRGTDYDHYKHYGFTGADGKMVYGRGQISADASVNYLPFNELKGEKIRQRRDGQNCDDIDVSNIPAAFRESTHCLKFSNLWYSVYRIAQPEICHNIRIQIFQKYEDLHGNTHWMDLTHGKVVQLSTELPSYIDKDFVSTYSTEELDAGEASLDYKNFKLLVPEKKLADAEQFMLLPNKLVSTNGRTCNTAGVGYEGFYKQDKRCSSPEGSCLYNQPQHLYEKDMEATKEGKPTEYFLKSFASLPEDAVAYNASGQIQHLKLLYTKEHESNLYVEINADLVTLLQPNSYGTITEVYTDATNPTKTRIVVKLTNSGLLYGVFYVRVSGCPLDVSASFNNLASKSVLITSQHQHIFNMFIEYPLPLWDFHCSIHAHNINQEMIAVRRIRIRSYDRCICIWYCECACYVADGGLRCTIMSLKSYHASGFQGGFPVATHIVQPSYWDEMLALLFSMFMFLLLTLFVMGLIKAVFGLCISFIGLWGLDIVLDTQGKITVVDAGKRYEFRDDPGISIPAQFCINVLFFFLFPCALFNLAMRKYCFARYTMEDECSCVERWIDYECESEISNKSSDDSANKSKGTVADNDQVASKKTVGGVSREPTQSASSSETISSEKDESIESDRSIDEEVD